MGNVSDFAAYLELFCWQVAIYVAQLHRQRYVWSVTMSNLKEVKHAGQGAIGPGLRKTELETQDFNKVCLIRTSELLCSGLFYCFLLNMGRLSWKLPFLGTLPEYEISAVQSTSLHIAHCDFLDLRDEEWKLVTVLHKLETWFLSLIVIVALTVLLMEWPLSLICHCHHLSSQNARPWLQQL